MHKVPILFGEVLFDCFEDGSRVLGGAPFNVAWHLQAFGCSPLFISRVGDDPMGRQIRDTMQHWGMTTAGLQMDSSHPTGEVKVTLEAGQPVFDILANRAFDYIQADCTPPVEPFLIYHGSLGLRQAQSADTLASLLNKHPVPVFLDVNLRPPWWNWTQLGLRLDRAHWVKVNESELDRLVTEPGDLQTKAKLLLAHHGLTWLIVTLGSAGVLALDKHRDLVEAAPASAIQVVDTVGAGDAFSSVCILGLLKNWSLNEILHRAQEFASLIVSQRGATIDDPELYKPFIKAWSL